jgi:hypothetical protein
MRFALREAGGGIAAVTIHAAEHDILADMHGRVLDAFMAFNAAQAFVYGLLARLIDPIPRRQSVRI